MVWRIGDIGICSGYALATRYLSQVQPNDEQPKASPLLPAGIVSGNAGSRSFSMHLVSIHKL